MDLRKFLKSKLIAFIYSISDSGILRLIFRKHHQELDIIRAQTFDTVEEFINAHSDFLKKIELGHSYSVEHMNYLNSFNELPDSSKPTHLEALNILTNEIGLKSIRLGIRWCDVDFDGKVNIEKYKEVVKYCLENKLSICLNVGPIKVFRWPEVYVPDRIVNAQNIGTDKYEITAESEISKESIIYLEKLFDAFEKEFGREFFDKIKTVQVDNEMFNPFGTKRWYAGFDHLFEIIKSVNKRFKTSKILLSISGGPNEFDILNPDVLRVQKFIKSFIPADLVSRIVIGFNFYYQVPGLPRDRNGNSLDAFSVLKIINGKNILKNIKQWASQNKVDFEVTELQFEPWGEHGDAGLNFRGFQFSLLRLKEIIQLENQPKTVLRLWGTELFAQKFFAGELSEDQEKIVELIQEIDR
jgi:hypothetical protein